MNNSPRLNQQLIDLQQEINIATGKLHKVREALILETRIEEKLRIEYQIELTEQTLDQLNQRYDKLEEYLSNIGLKELPNAAKNPYKSLAAFQEEDAEQFFGRETFVKLLIEKYQQVKILPLLGPSGSGKSSVARAGLIPELKQIDIRLKVLILTPTDRPLENLANHLARLITQDPFPIAKTKEFEDFLLKEKDALRRILSSFSSSTKQTLVILIDQFEEIYTLCKDKTQQTAFIENILTLNEEQHLSAKIVLTLRSDFLGETQQHSKLNQLLAKDSVIVPAMNENELRDAISKPAELAGHPLDEATINLLLEQTEGRASALPLLQFALTQIWDNMSKGISAAQTLSECGGVGGALAKKAEEVFAQLTEEDQKVTRRIFLKLVQLGEGAKDTRRRTPLSEMIAQQDESAEKVKLILERFARQDVRLLSLATQTVENNCIFAEITHEALLDNWQLLQEWLKDGREAERFHRRVHEAAQLWQLNQQPIGSLWRSPDLDLLATFYASHSEDMTALEINFFNSSREQQQREINEKLEQQRRLKLLTTVALLIAMIAGLFYFQAEQQTEIALNNENKAKEQTKIAEDQKKLALDSENKAKEQANIAKENEEKAKEQETIAQNNAQQALQEKQNAIEQRNEALKTQSLFLADLSEQELKKGNAIVSILLALEALPKDMSKPDRPYIIEAEEKLYNGITLLRDKARLIGHKGEITGLTFSPDGKQIATASKDGTGRLWRVETGEQLKILEGHSDAVYSIEFSPNGKYLVTASKDGTARIWESKTGKVILILEDQKIGAAHFVSNGEKIITISQPSHLWNAQTGKQLATFDGGMSALSGDKQNLLTTNINKGEVFIWNTNNGKKISTILLNLEVNYGDGKEKLSNLSLNTIFSFDKQKIILSLRSLGGGCKLEVWDIKTGKQINNSPTWNGHCEEIAISPDNETIVIPLYPAGSGGHKNPTILWNIKNGKINQLPQSNKSQIEKAIFISEATLFTLKENSIHIFSTSQNSLLEDTEETIISGYENINSIIVKNEINLAAISSKNDAILLNIEPNGLRLKESECQKPFHKQENTENRYDYDDENFLKTIFKTNKYFLDFLKNNASVYNITFNKNHTKALVSLFKGKFYLWDIASGKQLGTLHSASETYDRLEGSFNNDETCILLDDGHDKKVWWKAFPTTQALIDYANKAVIRKLSCEERQRFFLSLPKECTAVSQAKETNNSKEN